jgi:catechol 2,3-dioxygenase-like lactoylglutathione lyase family enzyme
MTVELNHIIVHARNKRASGAFLGGILGVEVDREWGPFVPVQVANGVTRKFLDSGTSQHCALLVSEPEFNASFARIQQAGLTYWADRFRRRRGETNHEYGGRGVYFEDPAGHLMELVTQPDGATPAGTP